MDVDDRAGVDVDMEHGAEGAAHGDDDGRTTGKKQRCAVRPTVSEMMAAAVDAVAGQSQLV